MLNATNTGSTEPSSSARDSREKVPDLSVPGWVEIAGDWRWIGAGRPAYRDVER